MTTTSHEPLVWYSHADPHNSAEGFEGPIDVFFRRSLDGGRLWTARRALNDDHANRKRANKYEVGVSVAPNGRLDVAWYDFRLSPATAPTSSQGEAGLQDVFYVSSGDRGKTFSRNLHITDRSIDRSIGVCSNNIDSKFNLGIASPDEAVSFAWQDTRNGKAELPAEDIYAASLKREGPERASSESTTRFPAGCWCQLDSASAWGSQHCSLGHPPDRDPTQSSAVGKGRMPCAVPVVGGRAGARRLHGPAVRAVSDRGAGKRFGGRCRRGTGGA